jgi:hypothetical protein
MSDLQSALIFPMTIDEAYAAGLCRLCNFAGRGKYEHKPCDYHRILNYMNVPSGRCALKADDIDRKRQDMALGRR